MAKKRRRSSHRIRRDAIARRYSSAVPRSAAFSSVRPLPLMLEDRRLYHPDPLPIAQASIRSASRLVAKQNPRFKQPSQTKAIIAFAEPSKVSVCVRRGIRKQVIHALGVAGGKVRRGRRSAYSDISCK